MQIRIDNSVIELRPDRPQETAELELLWRKLVDCLGDNRRISPIGEYIPVKDNVARFLVEEPASAVADRAAHPAAEAVTAQEDCTVVCTACNKYMALKEGEEVPVCCGRTMEAMD